MDRSTVFSGHSVSIHTVTQDSRLEWIPHCFRMIQSQDYKDIREWVIGNGSRTEEGAATLLDFLTDFFMRQEGSEKMDPCKFPAHSRDTQKEKEGESKSGSEDCPASCIRLASGLLIKILPWKEQILGEVRGQINRHCAEKFIVSFDDDDIYPDYRVSLAITCLLNSKKEVLGSSSVYLYDVNTRALVKFNKVSDTHATHLTLAYTKEYATKHEYGTEKKYAEEKKFLQNFKVPMYQLQPEQAVLQIVHGRNTFEKSRLLHRPIASVQMEGTIPASNQCTFCSETDVLTFLQGLFPSEERAKQELDRVHEMGRYVPRHVTLTEDNSSEEVTATGEPIQNREGSDFAFYLGVLSDSWDPCVTSNLRGMKRAVQLLASQLAEQGNVVHVYGMFPHLQNDGLNCSSSEAYLNFMEFQGVKYIHAVDFPFQFQFKNLILCEARGAAVPLFAKVQAERLVLDLFGEFPTSSALLLKLLQEDRLNDVDCIFTRSKFQCTFLIQQISKLLDEKTKVGPEQARERVSKAFLPKFKPVPSGLEPVVLKVRDRLLSGEQRGEEAPTNPAENDEEDPNDDMQVTEDAERILNCIQNQKKIPYRIVFVSDYSKGLARFLQLAWPTVREKYPNAELHCYYGRQKKQKLDQQEIELGYLLGQEGVIDHGAVSHVESLLARASARVQVAVHGGYQTVDGVSVREAIALKCIPIMSGTFAYGERDGIHLEFKKWDQAEYRELAMRICSILELTDEEFDEKASGLLQSQLLFSWRATSQKWLQYLGQVTENGEASTRREKEEQTENKEVVKDADSVKPEKN